VQPVVRLRSAVCLLGRFPALAGVDLDVAPGEVVLLSGGNGAGKTTLLRLILGLMSPSAGTIRLFGVAPAAFRDWRRLGYVPQRTSFDAALPVRVDEVVTTGLVASRPWFRGSGAAARRVVTEALGFVGMGDRAEDRVGALSAGQQQRVLIARALVSAPELLILDEPTGGIDTETQTSFYALLRHLNRERGVTLVLVSHDVGVVAQEVTKLACLNCRVIFCGRPQDYFADERLTALYGTTVRLVGHEPPCAHAG